MNGERTAGKKRTAMQKKTHTHTEPTKWTRKNNNRKKKKKIGETLAAEWNKMHLIIPGMRCACTCVARATENKRELCTRPKKTTDEKKTVEEFHTTISMTVIKMNRIRMQLFFFLFLSPSL